MPKFELLFQRMINNNRFFHDHYFSGFYNPLYKYTIELLYDGYTIPDKYIVAENRILFEYGRVYKILGKRCDVDIIKKLSRYSCSRNIDYFAGGAAKAGNVDVLKWMKNEGHCFGEYEVSCAVAGGQIEVVKWVVENSGGKYKAATATAAKKGYFDILKYLVIDLKYKIDESAGYYAAANGDFEMVKFLYSMDPIIIESVRNGAMKSGNIDILKFAYDNGTFDHVYSFSNVISLRWLIDNDHIHINIETARTIARGGNLECLQFVHNIFSVLDAEVFANAIHSKNIKMIEWLYKLNCPRLIFPLSTNMFSTNSKMGENENLTILKILFDMGYELNNDLCHYAARDGDLEMLQFLYTNGCTFDENVMAAAAYRGHLHIIIWLREHNCKWNAKVCLATVAYNHIDILK